MRSMLPATKAVLLVLTAAFLSACNTEKTQLFIFSQYSYETYEHSYYKTDLYNPSYSTKIDTTLCSEGDRFITWSPNGNYYVCSGIDHQIFFIYDVVNNKVIAQSEPESSGNMLLGKWSPDSQYISIVNMPSRKKPYIDFSIMKLDGTITQIHEGPASEYFFDSAWSPNGEHLILEITPPHQDSRQSILAIFKISGEEVSQFDMPPDFIVRQIRWSPKSGKLAFTAMDSISNIKNRLYVFDTVGGETTDIISEMSLCVNDISGWSPDGQKILFSAHDCEIVGSPYYPVYFSVNPDGSELKQLSEEGMGMLYWSPDSKFIVVDEYGNGISLMDIDGNNKGKLVDKGNFISWITP